MELTTLQQKALINNAKLNHRKIPIFTLDKDEFIEDLLNRREKDTRLYLNSYELMFLKSLITQDYKAEEITINGELCKRVINHSRYVVSISGRIYRTVPASHVEYLTYAINKKLNYLSEKQRILTQGHEYLRVSLLRDTGKLSFLQVKNLVYKHFSTKKLNRGLLIHIDNDINNCHIDNLKKTIRKPSNYKLTQGQVKEIKEQLKNGASLANLAAKYCVSDMQIHRIKTGENWSKKQHIQKPVLPFYVDNIRIRKILYRFTITNCNECINMLFTIIRDGNNPENNKIKAIKNGFKFEHNHKNITRAKELVKVLNDHFFNNE